MKINYKEIGSRIKKRRKELGYTQEYVSDHTGITTFYLSKMENGHVRFSLDTLTLVIDFLEMDIGFALFGTKINYNNPKIIKLLDFYENATKDQQHLLEHIIELINTLNTHG